MLDANKSVTVTCSWYDGTADADQEASFTLDGVSVHIDHSASPSTGGVTASNLARIRIPYRDGYLPEDQWIERQKSTHWNKKVWTLRIGDTIFVNGEKKTIMRWHDNTNRRFEPHWYVEAR